MKPSPTVLIMNGPSASGKSTTQKAIQRLADAPYLSLGVDNLFDTILPDSLNIGAPPQGNFCDADVRSIRHEVLDGHPSLAMVVGPIGLKAVRGMHRAIAAYAAAGNDLVVDYIAYDQAWLIDLAQVLTPYRSYYFGFDIRLEEVERREQGRGTSPVGHARSHYHTVHGERIYDLVVDVNAATPESTAALLLDHVTHHPTPRALHEILTRAPRDCRPSAR